MLLHFQRTCTQHKVEERRPYFPNMEVLGRVGRVTCSLAPRGESLWPAGFSELVLAPGEGSPAAGFEHRHTHRLSANQHGSIYSLLRKFTKRKGSKTTNTIITHASLLTIPSQGTRNASSTSNPGTPNYPARVSKPLLPSSSEFQLPAHFPGKKWHCFAW